MSTPSPERVTANTAPEVNKVIRHEADDRVRACARAGPAAIAQRLEELDHESDVERVLEAEAGVTILLGSPWGDREPQVLRGAGLRRVYGNPPLGSRGSPRSGGWDSGPRRRSSGSAWR